MTTIAHLSDLHFGPHYQPQVGAKLLETLQTLQVDMVVISGDLTHRAKAHEFTACRNFLESLEHLPIVIVPGNHDIPLYNIWRRFTKPRAGFDAHFGAQYQQAQSDNCLIAGVDSVDPYRSVVNGRVSAAALDRISREFAQAASSPGHKLWRVVVLHHHLLPPPGYDRRRPMPKAKRLLHRLDELNVDLILSGHLHRAYVGNTLDIHPGANRSEGMVVVQCGTSTSRRGRGYEREKNSFNLITLADSLRVEHWMYFSASAAPSGFQRVSKHDFSAI